MACGADGVELDVAVTLDDRLVVTHDLVLAGGLTVREHTAAELPLPLLDEVLGLAAPENFWFDIEAKSEPGLTPDAVRYAALLSDAIHRSGARHRILVRSFDHDFLRAFHEVEPAVPLSALIEFESDDWVSIAQAAGASSISPGYLTVTRERVGIAHAAGIRVSVWTVNARPDWERMRTMGVDAVITDDPCAMVRWQRTI